MNHSFTNNLIIIINTVDAIQSDENLCFEQMS